MCNCKLTELVLGIIILVFVFLYSYTDWSSWIIAIAAVLLMLHALLCKNHCNCKTPEPIVMKKEIKKKRR